jgi:transketolase
MGDFVTAALNSAEKPVQVKKMAVDQISRSGKMEELLELAGINAAAIVNQVHALVPTVVFH